MRVCLFASLAVSYSVFHADSMVLPDWKGRGFANLFDSRQVDKCTNLNPQKEEVDKCTNSNPEKEEWSSDAVMQPV